MLTIKIFTTLSLGLLLNSQAAAMQSPPPTIFEIFDKVLAITSKMNDTSIDAAIKASEQNNETDQDIILKIRAASDKAKNEFMPELNKILEQDEELKIAITTAYRQITRTHMNWAPETAEDELNSIKNCCNAQHQALLKIKLTYIFEKIVAIEEKMSSACVNKSWEMAEAECRKEEINEKESAMIILEASKKAANEFMPDFRNIVILFPNDLQKKIRDSLDNISKQYEQYNNISDIVLTLESVENFYKAVHQALIKVRNLTLNKEAS